MLRTPAAVLFAAITLLAPSVAPAIELPVAYWIDGKQIKDATAATPVTFDLFSDPACTALIHTETVALADTRGIEKLIFKKVKEGPKPPKALRLNAVLVGVTPAATHYLTVTGTGIVPVGEDCQVQAAGIPGPAGLACWDLNENGTCDLGTEDVDVSGDCDALDCQGPPALTITKMIIQRTTNTVSLVDANGVAHSLDLTNCSDGTVCVDPTGHIALADATAQSNIDSTLHFNIGSSPSLTCTLFHSDDDSPRPGLYFSTDSGNGLTGIWGNSTTPTFSLRQDGNSGQVLANFAGYTIVCL